MNKTEKEAWQAFRGVIDGFLVKLKGSKLQRVGEKAYQKLRKHGLSHVCKTSFFML